MWKKAKLNSKKIWKIQMHIPNQTLGATSDLAINVPQNIKEKIQKGEYVDISVLLTNNQHNTDTNQKVIILGEATKRIISPFNLSFFHIFHIISHFNLPFFHVVHILSLFDLLVEI
jgi:hypothetical protein